MEQVRGITFLQWLGIALIIDGTLTSSLNELTDMFGSVWAHHIVSLTSILSSIAGGMVTMFGGQAAMIRNVAGMPGVDAIKVNAQANQTLATIAVDHTTPKVEVLPEAKIAVAQAARGA